MQILQMITIRWQDREGQQPIEAHLADPKILARLEALGRHTGMTTVETLTALINTAHWILDRNALVRDQDAVERTFDEVQRARKAR